MEDWVSYHKIAILDDETQFLGFWHGAIKSTSGILLYGYSSVSGPEKDFP